MTKEELEKLCFSKADIFIQDVGYDFDDRTKECMRLAYAKGYLRGIFECSEYARLGEDGACQQ